MAAPNQDELIATVFERVIGKKPNDNIFNSRALFFLLNEGGFKEEADGGRLIEFTLQYATNSTFRSYTEFESLDNTRINVLDVARFDWKINAGTVNFSELERLRAMGDSAKIDLVETKLQNAKDSHIATMNIQCFSDGSSGGGNDIGGLQLLIATAPTTGTVGGINRATFTFWRNQQTSGAKTTNAFDNLRATMRTIFNKCSRGGVEETPTAWITDRATFEGYEGLLTPNERFLPVDKFTKKHGDAGFINDILTFKGAAGSFDEDAPAGNVYFFNDKNLKFVYLSGGWMKMYPDVMPANQLVRTYKLATFGNLGTNNSRRLGVVSGVT